MIKGCLISTLPDFFFFSDVLLTGICASEV